MSKTKMSKEREQSLRKLAKLMNSRHQLPFPITKPLLDCFDLVITPEEVDFLTRMGTETHTYEQAASLSNLSEESFRPFFETQLKKGLVWSQAGPDGKDRFSLPGIMVGWFETYLSDGSEVPKKEEFARRLDNLFNSWRRMNFFPFRSLLNYKFKRRLKPHQRIVAIRQTDETKKATKITVDRPIKVPETKVYPSDSVYELIDKHGDGNDIAVVHCFCRQWHKMVDEPCRLNFPSEACIVIGVFTRHVVDYGIGRYISKDNALELIQDLHEKGAVHQVFHEREDVSQPEIAICNCCWDCCGVLGSYNRGILPLHFKSYYQAQISDQSLCNGCGTCEEHCPVQAISVKEEKSYANPEKCIGCGQCELQCPEDVITMVPNEREVMLPLQKKSEARITW